MKLVSSTKEAFIYFISIMRCHSIADDTSAMLKQLLIVGRLLFMRVICLLLLFICVFPLLFSFLFSFSSFSFLFFYRLFLFFVCFFFAPVQTGSPNCPYQLHFFTLKAPNGTDYVIKRFSEPEYNQCQN